MTIETVNGNLSAEAVWRESVPAFGKLMAKLALRGVSNGRLRVVVRNGSRYIVTNAEADGDTTKGGGPGSVWPKPD